MTKSDLIIIGCGPGGYEAAIYAAKKGLNVIVFEEEHVGGTCLNVGCIPTKTMAHAADVLLEMTGAAEFGIDADAHLSFSRLMAKKDEVVQRLVNGVSTLMQTTGITLIKSTAQLKDQHTVIAEGNEYSADNIIIATGAKASVPPFITNGTVLNYNTLLEMTEQPASLCIIGAGVIGMEFASIFSALGTEVTVVEYLGECLATVDGEIARRVRRELEKRGVKFYLKAQVTAAATHNVTFIQKGVEHTLETDKVLSATGVTPSIDSLNLDDAGIIYDRHGVRVNEEMQTNIPHIYAIGDVNGRMMTANMAKYQGFRAVNHILGRTDRIRFDIIPSAVFTNPEIGTVGLSDQQLKAAGITYVTRKGVYRSNGKALAMGAEQGLVKVYCNAEGQIIGCHIIGAHAAELAQEAAVLMNAGINIDALHDIVHIHPSLPELLGNI